MTTYKTFAYRLATALFFLLAVCCKKETPSDGEPGPVFGVPEVKPKGQPVGDAVSVVLGPQGGVLWYDDVVRLEIPPGAVVEPTTFSIQPITNTLHEVSARAAFHLTPEGVGFKKPIRLSFIYPSDSEGNPTARAVAFQRGDGVWCGVPTRMDAAHRRLTVETTHFSDWVWFDMLSLRKDKETVRAGEVVNLKLLEQVLGALMPTSSIDSVPLAAMDDVGASKDVTVSGWKIIAGPGTLEPKLNTKLMLGDAIYTAPQTVDQPTDVEIQVEVESKSGYISDPTAPNGRRKLGKMMLITTIRLLPETFIQLKLNGVDQGLPQVGVARMVNGALLIRSSDERINLTLQCQGTAPGTYAGGQENGQAWLYLSRMQGGTRRFLNNFYRSCNGNEKVFNGTATISMDDGFVEGSFVGSLYPSDVQNCEIPEATAVEFTFKIKRSLTVLSGRLKGEGFDDLLEVLAYPDFLPVFHH